MGFFFARKLREVLVRFSEPTRFSSRFGQRAHSVANLLLGFARAMKFSVGLSLVTTVSFVIVEYYAFNLRSQAIVSLLLLATYYAIYRMHVVWFGFINPERSAAQPLPMDLRVLRRHDRDRCIQSSGQREGGDGLAQSQDRAVHYVEGNRTPAGFWAWHQGQRRWNMAQPTVAPAGLGTGTNAVMGRPSLGQPKGWVTGAGSGNSTSGLADPSLWHGRQLQRARLEGVSSWSSWKMIFSSNKHSASSSRSGPILALMSSNPTRVQEDSGCGSGRAKRSIISHAKT
mmetsp:Transcript_10175/g.18058  ORF Transcript_10175/g.18058 Transcript_10175/m.18058 type:complete len:285 (+) Transcript_10175:145-999(+)